MGFAQIILLALVVLLAARLLGIKDVASLFASTTRVIGFIGIVAALFLLMTGRWPAAIGVGLFAMSLLGWDLRSMVLSTILGGGGKGPARQGWRRAYLDLSVDAAGRLDGKVLKGRFTGRKLSTMSPAELLQLREDAARDPDSLDLVEAYLDRRIAGWRENLKGDAAFRESRPARPGTMTDQEAYQILGLQPGAGRAEIMEAYRRLMKAVHPDAGGSAFLAAKVNEARDRLATKHERAPNT